MNGPRLLLVLCALVALRPYEVARAKERIDAVGSDREPAEPTPQNVFVFRAVGPATFIVGVTFLLWLLAR